MEDYSSLVWVISICLYVYTAVCLMLLAKKTNTPNGWMAWIPIFNLYLMCKLGNKSGAWIILLFIPFINIIFTLLIWAGIARRTGRSGWLAILMLIPGINLILMAVLAFSEPRIAAGPPGGTTQPRPSVPGPQPGGFPQPRAPVPEPQPGEGFCPQCGAAIDASTRFCPSCGAALPTTIAGEEPAKKFCSQCGVEVDSDTRFCPNCGASL
jgi:RNA polymerase subunit RPABC4/transcription elongation factor Spt4